MTSAGADARNTWESNGGDLTSYWHIWDYCSYSYIPKPILQALGSPDGLKFTIRDGYVEVSRPD